MKVLGQDRAVDRFSSAWTSRRVHHAWLLAGPKGVGKATFALAAARRVLAESAGPPFALADLESPDEHPIVRLIEAGSHPDMRMLSRLERTKGEGLARDITIDQVRALGEFMSMAPAMSDRRVVVIDAMDDLNVAASNGLLKMLEEPPAGTIFFLVSHAPGKLLPTIRSRCRRLDFKPLAGDVMASILASRKPDLAEHQRRRIATIAAGSAGRALGIADLGLDQLEDQALQILRKGDSTNALRSDLSRELAKKASAERYAAFLDLVPTLIAREARSASGMRRQRALDSYALARSLATMAPRLSLDPGSTVFRMGTFLAAVADRPSLKR